MSKIFPVFIFIMAVLLIAGCSTSSSVGQPPEDGSIPGGETREAAGNYTNLSVAELQTMLEDKDFELINVHIPYEGDLPQTDLSIPYNEMDQNLDLLPDKDAKIVLYCRSDRMSTIAAERMVELGYTNVWNLEGGMVAWEQAGLPLVRP